MNKYHERITEWVDKEPEFDGWPVGPKKLQKDKSFKFDKSSAVMVQPELKDGLENSAMMRPKPDIGRQMTFEIPNLEEKYGDDLEPYDSEDVITIEKGEDAY